MSCGSALDFQWEQLEFQRPNVLLIDRKGEEREYVSLSSLEASPNWMGRKDKEVDVVPVSTPLRTRKSMT